VCNLTTSPPARGRENLKEKLLAPERTKKLGGGLRNPGGPTVNEWLFGVWVGRSQMKEERWTNKGGSGRGTRSAGKSENRKTELHCERKEEGGTEE